MSYGSLSECIRDLERNGHLVRIRESVSPYLEMAEIHRRVSEAGGPAILYERVEGCRFPAVSNLFGTMERCRFIFRHTLDRTRRLLALKACPQTAFRSPISTISALLHTPHALPRRVKNGPVLAERITIGDLPPIVSWPRDGGPFITLPQVYSEAPDRPGILHSNLGMYRIQLAGNEYGQDEIGLHYQIHRGIGVHHAAALACGKPLKVSIFVGGPPAHTLAAVLPLPEGLPEVLFAGLMAGRRFRYAVRNGHVISADADFCILGTVHPDETRPEGPFGDHLGYYSLIHPFPFIRVQAVYCRKDAVWPFTVVGRPPQEDTSFGKLIHELVAPLVPREIPGLKAIHAVDAAGVHPLLLAIGSERYVPYQKRRPMELLTTANALLGFGQCSLAKYLLIVAGEDAPGLDIQDIPAFFRHLLERIDWRRDLHFQTSTTMDTLDYTGTGLNEGSKVVMAAAGEKKRVLEREIPAGLTLPEGYGTAVSPIPGILVIQGPPFQDYESENTRIGRLAYHLTPERLPGFPLVVIVDDANFCASSFKNFLWVTFTRSDPARDIHGVDPFIEAKHWGCRGSLIIDARAKPHHSPALVEDPAITRRVERLAATGGPLHGII
ncbi:MAG: UbiD family decarboxylase [Deltaproteobacteria bacterium]